MIVLVILLVATLSLWLFSLHYKAKQRYKHIPGDNQFLLPPLASLFPKCFGFKYTSMADYLWKDVQRAHKEHGPIVKVVFMHRGFMFINDTDFGKLIQSKHKCLSKQSRFISNFTDLFGVNVLTAIDDETWKFHRRVLNPAFANLEYVVRATEDVMKKFVESNSTIEVRDIQNDMSAITMDIIGLAGFGYSFNDIGVEKNMAVKLQYLMKKIPFYGDIPNFIKKWNIRMFKKVRDIAAEWKALARRLLNQESARDTMLKYIKTESFDDDYCISNLSTLLIAGHETTNKALVFALDFLSRNQKFQEEAYSEIKTLPNAPLAISDVEKLVKVNHVWKETLRLIPVIVGLVRSVTETFQYKGYDIPKDTLVIYNWIQVHRNKLVYGQDAEEFNPDRWYDINPSPLEYSPFGIGHRSCIGKKFADYEAIVILAYVIKNYIIEPTDDKPPNVEFYITLRPSKPVMIRFRKRL